MNILLERVPQLHDPGREEPIVANLAPPPLYHLEQARLVVRGELNITARPYGLERLDDRGVLGAVEVRE